MEWVIHVWVKDCSAAIVCGPGRVCVLRGLVLPSLLAMSWKDVAILCNGFPLESSWDRQGKLLAKRLLQE
jgi:hypothetical protein